MLRQPSVIIKYGLLPRLFDTLHARKNDNRRDEASRDFVDTVNKESIFDKYAYSPGIDLVSKGMYVITYKVISCWQSSVYTPVFFFNPVTGSPSQNEPQSLSCVEANLNELGSFLSIHESTVGEFIREGKESNFISLLEALGRTHEEGRFADYQEIRLVQLELTEADVLGAKLESGL